MSGKKVNSKLEGDRIYVKDLQPGNYIINIKTDEQNYTKKFIKK